MAGKQMQQTGDLASGTEGRDFVLGQAASIVLQAPTQAGQTIEQRLESGQQAVLDFDAAAATPSVEGDNFVLSFDTDGDGASDSQVIFLGLVAQSQVADAPVLVINGVEIAANQLIGQALALAEGDGTLETAAGTGAGNGPAGGGGGSSYSDDTGESIDLLNAQGVLGETGLGATRFLNPDDATLSNFPTITAANETVILDDDDFGAHGNSGGVGDDTPINVEGTLSHNYGGDGAGSVLLLGTGAPAGFSYAVTAGGTLLTITQNGVAVMTVALGDTTSGNYKITQLAPITHPAGDDENNVDFIFNYRVTDGSGDSVDGSLRLSVDDDTPVAADPITDSVDESAIQGDTWAVAKGTITADFGADGGKFSDVTLDTNGLTAAGQPVTTWLTDSDDGKSFVLIGYANGKAVFDIYVNKETGAYNYRQFGALDHDGKGADSLKLKFGYEVTDGDGDKDSGKLIIKVKDSVPDVANRIVDSVDESAIQGDNWAVAKGTITADFGADGGKFSDVTLDTNGLTAAGQPVTTWLTDSDDGKSFVLIGYANGKAVFDIYVNKETGAYNYRQFGALDHDGKGADSLKLKFGYEVTDGDGDKDSGKLIIKVKDSVPDVANRIVDSVDESAIQGDTWAVAKGTIDVDFGADGGQFSDVTLDTSGLTAAGQPVTTWLTDSDDGKSFVLIGYANGKAVFDIYVNKETGAYNYRQFGALDHDGKGADSLKLKFGYEVTDGDGDKDSGKLIIKVKDSVPTALDDADSVLEDSGLAATGNVVTGIDVAAGDANDTDGTADKLGADGFQSIVWTDTDLVDDGNDLTIVGKYGTLTFDALGNYSYQLDNSNAAVNALKDGEKLKEEFNYTIKDKDGDESSAKLVIDIDGKTDVTPVPGPVAPWQLNLSAGTWQGNFQPENLAANSGNTTSSGAPLHEAFGAQYNISTHGDIEGHVVATNKGDQINISSVNQIKGGIYTFAGDDSVEIVKGNVSGDVVLGAGADRLKIGNGVIGGDVLGEAGNDSIYVNAGGVITGDIAGGDGDDGIYVNGLGSIGGNILGGDGDDNIFVNPDAKVGGDILGGDGNDRIYVNPDAHVGGDILGGAGNDYIYVNGNGFVGGDILGGDGDDYIVGGNSADRIFGGVGNDTINGNGGNDSLSGGDGADSFVFDADALGGIDTITDFDTSEGDKLNLKDLLSGFTAGVDNDATATILKDYLSISLDGTTTVITVDQDGAGAGSAVATIRLDHVDLTAGGSIDNHDAIKALLDGNNLIVD